MSQQAANKTKRARLAAVSENNRFVLIEDAFRCNLQTYCYKCADDSDRASQPQSADDEEQPSTSDHHPPSVDHDDEEAATSEESKRYKDIPLMLNSVRDDLNQLLFDAFERDEDEAIKFNLLVECTYAKTVIRGGDDVDDDDDEVEDTHNVCFKTMNLPIHSREEVSLAVEEAFQSIISEEANHEGKGSGWALKSIDDILLRINRFKPLRGKSYIDLPAEIKSKKAVVNVQNDDEHCFKWSILCKHIAGRNPQRVDRRYWTVDMKKKYDFGMVNFPTPINDIRKFENANNVSVNVYTIGSKNSVVKPLKVCDYEKDDHFDLLYLKNEETQHYCYISNLSRLISSQLSSGDKAVDICKRCFTHYRKTDPKCKEKMANHLERCRGHKPARISMPAVTTAGSNPTLKFKNFQNEFPVPIVAYADFECILQPVPHYPTFKKAFTRDTERHIPMSYCLHFVCDNDLHEEIRNVVPQSPILYRGYNAAAHFRETLVDISTKIANKLDRKEGITMTPEHTRRHNESVECAMCKKQFGDAVKKVRDHCHFTGRYRDALCNGCNLRRRTQNQIPVFIHNAANYDSHFIITEMGYNSRRIHAIPRSSEKYVSFSKSVCDNLSVKFVDTFQFMASSLDSLVKNLPEDKFTEVAKYFEADDLPLISRKGVYPYEYTSSWAVLNETTLPPQDKFYSSLTDSHVTDQEYAHARNVWDHFKAKKTNEAFTLGDYSDVYLKSDVLLLAAVFENFRAVCMREYGLDCAHYLTAPSFSFDAMLHKTNVELELVTDADMYLFLESGIRGGITSCVKKHARANNPYVPSTYQPELPRSYLSYIDANNLYGYAMSRPLPLNSFAWIDDVHRRQRLLNDISQIPDDSREGYIFEVDVEYPQHLHDPHSDLPFLPISQTPPCSKYTKLMTTLQDKTKYICHYTTLKQAIRNGLIVTKVHRILQFQQEAWLKTYIDLNSRNRQAATNEFEKNFFKLMNNAVFGKCMENVRNRMNMEIVSCPKRLKKLISKPTFLDRIIFNENLCAVQRARDTVTLDKPIYVGLSILDISKNLMYDFHYDTMKRKYGSNLNLLYMDTDSFFYEIETPDLYRDMMDVDHRHHFDTSDYPKDHPCHSDANKKVLGKFKDETNSVAISEFVGLRAKMYCFKTAVDKVVKKAKGVKKCVVSKKISFEDYKACLEDPNLEVHRSMRSFQSRKHVVHTTVSNKLALANYDDKRVAIDRVNTLPWGHYKIPMELRRIYHDDSMDAG